jgi:hypothetical protein
MPRDISHDGIAARVDREMSLHMTRTEAIHRFGFCLPSRELLDVLKAHGPILEVGAGTGYMTALMRHHGIEVIGTDPQTPPGYGFEYGRFDPQQQKLSAIAAVRQYPKHTLFCSWPSYEDTWLRTALRAVNVGGKAILIEESCCGDESTWRYRDQYFDELAPAPIPQWPGLHDSAALWVKRIGGSRKRQSDV